MAYQVFARKYRPLTFDQILGQDHVVQTLKNAIEKERIAQAYLFVGPRGTGKTTTARILAKALNCTNGPRVNFDPDEDICREIAEGVSLDVLEIDGASNNGVEQVRELRESAKFAPSRGRFKIYYIDEVHMLTTAAFNALLKILEEPPPHVKFIFATTEPNKILPTILSRCQRFDLRPISEKVIAEHLMHIAEEEKVGLDSMAAYAIAKGAEGGMRDAQSMLDQLVAFCGSEITETEVLDIFGFTAHETVARLTSALLEKKAVEALDVLHEQHGTGKDLPKLLGDLIAYLRNLLVCQVDPENAVKDLADEVASVLQGQASLIATDRLLDLIDHFAEVDARMKWAPNKLMHFEIGIIKAVQSLRESNLSDVIAALSDAFPSNGSGTETPTPAPASRSGRAPAAGKSVLEAPPVKVTSPSTRGRLPREAPSESSSDAISGPEKKNRNASPPAELDLWTQLKEKYLFAFSRAAFGGIDAGKFTVRFHSSDILREHALKQRKEVEAFLSSVSGKALALTVVLDDAIAVTDAGGPSPAGEFSGPPARVTDAGPQKSEARSEPPTKQAMDEKSFYDDPLIHDALEIFKGTLEKS